MLTALTCPAAGVHRRLGPPVTSCVHMHGPQIKPAQGGQLAITFDNRICDCTCQASTSVRADAKAVTGQHGLAWLGVSPSGRSPYSRYLALQFATLSLATATLNSGPLALVLWGSTSRSIEDYEIPVRADIQHRSHLRVFHEVTIRNWHFSSRPRPSARIVHRLCSSGSGADLERDVSPEQGNMDILLTAACPL